MQYIYLTLGFVAGFFIGKRFGRKETITTGFAGINAERHKAKEEALEKIMGLFDHQEEVANDHVERMLNVTDTTATNYLNELERRGQIEQIRVEGRSVRYRRK